tara:strand:- start:352 stop:600 length:249 start_codon:yes stop_codon:yes gene_type:complete
MKKNASSHASTSAAASAEEVDEKNQALFAIHRQHQQRTARDEDLGSLSLSERLAMVQKAFDFSVAKDDLVVGEHMCTGVTGE